MIWIVVGFSLVFGLLIVLSLCAAARRGDQFIPRVPEAANWWECSWHTRFTGQRGFFTVGGHPEQSPRGVVVGHGVCRECRDKWLITAKRKNETQKG